MLEMTDRTFHIRRATPADFEAISQTEIDGDDPDSKWSRLMYEHCEWQIGLGVSAIVGNTSGDPVGLVVYQTHRVGGALAGIELHHIVIRQDMRRKKFGSLLVDYLDSFLDRSSIVAIWGRVHERNLRSQMFLRFKGYACHAKAPCFFGIGPDESYVFSKESKTADPAIIVALSRLRPYQPLLS